MSTCAAESPGTQHDRDGAVRAGVAAMAPLVAGYMPFALVIGAAVSEHGSPLAGWSGSWLIYGGSAHLATIRTLDRSSVAVAIVTGLLINARLVIYSASLGRHWRDQPLAFRLLAAALIIDPTWMAAEHEAARGSSPERQRRFFIGAGLTLGIGWSAAIAVGAIAGPRLGSFDLQIVVGLSLIGLVGPNLVQRGSRLVLVCAALTTLVTAGWPAGTGLLTAIAVGCWVGLVSDRRSAS